jgi:hypothetical protein
LTTTDKPPIPWRRIFVESATIVISILLAFSIDAWWAERKERIEEHEILQSLQTEFAANRDEVASVVLVHEEALRYAAALMKLSDDEILALSDDQVERYVRYLAHPRTFDAVRGTVDALTSSGRLEILGDRELREALMTFVNILEDAEEDREYMFQWAMIVWQEVARNGGPFWSGSQNRSRQECLDLPLESGCDISNAMSYLPAATPEDLLRLRRNTTLMAYVNQGHENAARYVSEVRGAQQQIDAILLHLETSL